MKRQRMRKRAKLMRLAESLLCGLFVLIAYVALGYAVAMNAFFDAPDSWTNLMAVLSFALQIVVILMLESMNRERRTRR